MYKTSNSMYKASYLMYNALNSMQKAYSLTLNTLNLDIEASNGFLRYPMKKIPNGYRSSGISSFSKNMFNTAFYF